MMGTGWDERDMKNVNVMPSHVKTVLELVVKTLNEMASCLERGQRECSRANAFPAQQDLVDYQQRLEDLITDIKGTIHDQTLDEET